MTGSCCTNCAAICSSRRRIGLFEDVLPDLDRAVWLILHLRRVARIDLTAIRFLHQIASRLDAHGGQLVFCNGARTRRNRPRRAVGHRARRIAIGRSCADVQTARTKRSNTRKTRCSTSSVTIPRRSMTPFRSRRMTYAGICRRPTSRSSTTDWSCGRWGPARRCLRRVTTAMPCSSSSVVRSRSGYRRPSITTSASRAVARERSSVSSRCCSRDRARRKRGRRATASCSCSIGRASSGCSPIVRT